MRKIFTVPGVLPSLARERPPGGVRRYKSISGALNMETTELKSYIEDMPFIAVPGMGQNVRRMTQIISVRSFNILQTLPDSPSLSRRDSSYLSIQDDDVAEVFVPELKVETTNYLRIAVLVASLSAFQVGYNTSVINVPAASIRGGMSGGAINDFWWSLVVSIFCIGGLFGAYFGGSMADYLGRKRFLLAVNVFFITGCLFEALAYSVWMLLTGRFLIGFGAGGVSVVVPLFLGEVSPAQLRGAVGTLFQLSMVLGIFVATFIGGYIGTPSTWRYLLGITLVPAFLQLAFSPFLAESPRWLIEQNLKDEAKEVLRLLRGFEEGDPDDEIMLDFHFDLLVRSIPTKKYEVISSLEILRDPTLRLPLAIGFGLMIAQQLSGINAVFYYSTSFFTAAHVKDPWVGSVLATAVNVIATIFATFLMERIGRKGLLLISSMGMVISIVLLTIALFLMKVYTSVIISYTSVIAMLLFVVFFELGLGPIPWLISTEIFQPHLVATCASMSCSVNWTFNFVVGVTFPFLQNSLGSMTFIPFGLVCALCFICTLRYIPETKGKSNEEIRMDLIKRAY